MHNFKRKLIGAVICSTAMFSMLPATAFAHTGRRQNASVRQSARRVSLTTSAPSAGKTSRSAREQRRQR